MGPNFDLNTMQNLKTNLEKESLSRRVPQKTEGSMKGSCEEAGMAVDVPLEGFPVGTGQCECH